MSTSTPVNSLSLIALIEARQQALGLTDKELCEALGFEREIMLKLIKQNSMKMPLSKVPALAAVLSLDAADLLRAALLETAPELIAVIEEVYNPARLTTAEQNLIKHLRKLAGDRPCAPIVFDGKGVIAMVTT
jgi:transcriptional regulator with XRE-family HTH domain